MKRIKLVLILITFIMMFFTDKFAYASMADYTDEDAERDAQKMIEEHKENFDSTKSENNYLKELTVKGRNIIPNFDKQFLDYSVKIDDNVKEIDISAIPEDNRATVKGSGKVDISKTSECRIEVIAESGTTRTYFIKVVKENESDVSDDNMNKTELPDDEIDIGIVNKNYNIIKEGEEANEITTSKYKKSIIIGITSIMVLSALIFLIKSIIKISRY